MRFLCQRTSRLLLLALLCLTAVVCGLCGPAGAQPPKSRPELVLEIGHLAEITAVTFSPDGKTLASASRDKTAKLWDAQTGILRQTLSGHTDAVLAVVFSPDGKTVFTGCRDGTVRGWDAGTEQHRAGAGVALRGVLSGLPSGVTAMALAIAGTGAQSKLLVACAYPDHSIKFWQGAKLAMGQDDTQATFTGHEKPVRALAFSPGGRLLASGSEDGRVKIWELPEGDLLHTVRGHAMPVRTLVFSADGKTLADGSDDGESRLWDVETGKDRGMLHMNRPGDGVGAVAFAPKGALVVTGGHGGPKQIESLKIWDARTGAEKANLIGHEGFVGAVAVSPDGETVASGGRDHSVRLWDARTAREITAGGLTQSILSVAFSPNGERLASGSADAAVRVWNTRTGELQRLLTGHTGAVYAVAYSPDGSILASGSGDRTVRLWNAETGAPVRTIQEESGPVNALAFSPDGKTLACGTGAALVDGAVQLRDAQTGALKRTLTGQSLGMVRSVAFSPDGKFIATGSGVWSGGEVRVWDVQSGELLFKEFARAVRALAFSPDGRLLASGSTKLDEEGNPAGEEIQIWHGRTRALQRTFSLAEENGWTSGLAFSPDSKTLVSASRSGQVRIWNPRTGEALQTLSGHIGGALSTAVSPDGKMVASGGLDNTVRLWSAANGRLLATLVPVPADLKERPFREWITLTPDGYYDGSAGAGRRIRWRIGPDSFPVEAFEKTFHRPDAVRSILLEQPVPETPDAQRFAAGQAVPPQITFTTPRDGQQVTGDTLDVQFRVTDETKTTRVELLVNGRPLSTKPIELGARPIELGARPIELGARPLEIGAKPIELGARPIELGARPIPANHKTEQQFRAQVPLPPGEALITLTALAYNGRELQAREEVRVMRPTAVGAGGVLYVLTVGVSKYKNSRYDLKYAASDAASFAHIWEQKAGSLYERVEVIRLLDDQATAAGVRAALFQLLEKVTERDCVALFLSGHGVQGEQGAYYFATHEIDASTGARVAETALPWTAFQAALASLRARRVFLFLDACHSGNALGGQQAYNERLAEALVKRAGVMVFASSRGSEYSYELEELKHGAFTAALMEALAEGKADLEVGGQRDGVVTAEELLAYLRARVPQFTANRQTPACPLLRDFGEAFPMARVR